MKLLCSGRVLYGRFVAIFLLVLLPMCSMSVLSGCSFFEDDIGPEEESSEASKDSSSDESSPGEQAKEEEKDDEKPEYSQEDYLRKALSAYERGLYTVARDHFSKLREEYPGTPFESFAQLKIADSLFFARDFAAAIPIYEEFLKLHPGHEAAPYARLQLGNASLQQYTGPAHDSSPLRQAQTQFERLLQDYPDSYLQVVARKQIRYCKEALNDHERFVADFYNRAGQEAAMNQRLAKLPKSRPSEKSQELLVERKTAAPISPFPSLGDPSPAPSQDLQTQPQDTREQAPNAESTRVTAEPTPPEKSENVEEQHIIISEELGVSPKHVKTQQTSLQETTKLSIFAPFRKKSTPRNPTITCREEDGISRAELEFSGPFEVSILSQQGLLLAADIEFENEEDAIYAQAQNFSNCKTERFSLRLGNAHFADEGEDIVARRLSLRFIPRIQYRLFSIDNPHRLVILSFDKQKSSEMPQ